MYIIFEIYVFKQLSFPTYIVNEVHKANRDNESISQSLGIQFIRIVIFQFVDIGGINGHHCLNFLFIMWDVY